MQTSSHTFKSAFATMMLAIMVGGCSMTPVPAATASNPPAEPPPLPQPPMSCDASKGQWAVGKTEDEALMVKLMADTGARQSRILRPGMMVTMIFDGTRVNVRVDNNKLVLGVTCG